MSLDKDIPENAKLYYKAENKLSITSDYFDAYILSNEWDENTKEGVLVFNKEITTIYSSAFRSNHDLYELVIPETVTSIGSSVFQYCSKLEKLNISKNIKSIGSGCFQNYEGSIFIDCDMSIFNLNSFYSAKMKTIEFGENVTNIPKNIFCRSTIENLIISKSITSIGSQYEYITSTLPYKLYALQIIDSIIVHDDNPIYKSVDNCLLIKSNNRLLYGCNNSIISEEVTRIDLYAFYNATIPNLTIPSNITNINGFVVNGDTLTVNADLSLSTIDLGKIAYKTVYVGDNVTSINAPGFDGAHINRLVINKNITYINPESVHSRLNYVDIKYIDLTAFDEPFNIFNSSSNNIDMNLTATFIVPDELYDAWGEMPYIGKRIKAGEYVE